MPSLNPRPSVLQGRSGAWQKRRIGGYRRRHTRWRRRGKPSRGVQPTGRAPYKAQTQIVFSRQPRSKFRSRSRSRSRDRDRYDRRRSYGNRRD